MTGLVAFSIPVPAAYSFKETLWFLDRNYDECLHQVDGLSVRKAVEINAQRFLLEVICVPNHLNINILSGTPSNEDFRAIGHYLSEWFDLERSIQPFYDLLLSIPELAYMPEKISWIAFNGHPGSFRGLILGNNRAADQSHFCLQG